MEIRLGLIEELDKIEGLYNSVTERLEEEINYAGWKKGVYPTYEDAKKAIEEKSLYIAVEKEEILGSVVLNEKGEKAYDGMPWKIDGGYEKVLVVHTFLVNPKYLNKGVGGEILKFAEGLAKEKEKLAIRLDVFEKNKPAIKLYLKSGYEYRGKIDLGLGIYGLELFNIYEKLL